MRKADQMEFANNFENTINGPDLLCTAKNTNHSLPSDKIMQITDSDEI